MNRLILLVLVGLLVMPSVTVGAQDSDEELEFTTMSCSGFQSMIIDDYATVKEYLTRTVEMEFDRDQMAASLALLVVIRRGYETIVQPDCEGDLPLVFMGMLNNTIDFYTFFLIQDVDPDLYMKLASNSLSRAGLFEAIITGE